jgi:hypothetical protein
VLRQVLFPLLILTSAALPTASAAQETGTTVSLTVSPSFVDFDGWGGSFGAAVVRVSISRDFTTSVGAELTAFTLAPMGGAVAQPGCVPGGSCQSRATPNLLYGVLPAMYAWIGGSDFRVSAGVGFAGAGGGEGLDRRRSAAGLLGLDWVPRNRNRFVPTLALRVVQLGSSIAGARQLLLPGAGFSF